jgi:hypothetical protein
MVVPTGGYLIGQGQTDGNSRGFDMTCNPALNPTIGALTGQA